MRSSVVTPKDPIMEKNDQVKENDEMKDWMQSLYRNEKRKRFQRLRHQLPKYIQKIEIEATIRKVYLEEK